MIVTITANPCLDRNVVVQRMVSDDTMHPIDITDDPGGSGINVSRVLARFQRRTVAVGFLGGGTGKDIEGLLDREGVPHNFTAIRENTRTNMIISDQSTWEQYRLSFPGPHISSAEIDRFFEKMMAYTDAEFWSIGGSLPKGVPPTFYRDIVDLANANGIRVVLDTYGEPFAHAVSHKPFMVKPNQFELSRIVDQPLDDMDSFVAAAVKLHEMGVAVVVASRGSEGAVLVSDKGIWHAVPPKVEVKSKVGAGDSTIAGVLMALSDGSGHDEAVRMGVSCGTATTLTEGTSLCHKADVLDIFERVKVTRLR